MKNKARILRICTYFLVVVLGTTLILTACAKSSPESAPTADKINICFPMSNPESLDYTSSNSGTSTQWMVSDIFDRLADWDYQGKVISTTATWEILDGGKCYEFKIRPGIKFTSGDPLTARDVEFSWQRTLDNVMQFKGMLHNFDHLEVVDDYTVRFYLTQPNVLFLLQNIPMFLIASKSYYDRVGEEEFKVNPVGTGPYKFVKWESGQYVDLERNEDYWGEKPDFKQAHLVWSSEPTTSAAMLKAGEVDFLVEADWASVPDLEESGFKAVKFASANSYWLQFQTSNPDAPWADLKVRQAINYAIDKEALINTVFHGIPNKIDNWLSPWELGYDPALELDYPYDLEKAKELLAEAGYPNGFKMPLYRGSIFGPSAADAVEYLILALREVDIDVEPTLIEGPAIFEFFMKVQNDPTAEVTAVTAAGSSNGPDPTFGLSSSIHSSSSMSLYHASELDALIDEALATADDTQRGEIIKQIYTIVNADLPAVPLLSMNNVYMMKPNMDYKHRGRIPAFFFVSEITIE